MALTDVYRYKVFSNEHGSLVPTKVPVYATLKKIKELKAEPLMSTALQIDEAALTDQGFYHPK